MQIIKKKISKRKKEFIVFMCGIVIIMMVVWTMSMFYLTCHTLTTLTPQDVTAMTIYPGSDFGEPGREAIKFIAPDPIIEDFIKYVKDIRFLWTNLSPVASPYKESWWSLTITLKNKHVIEMNCSIPAKRPNMVHGELDKRALYQSKLLFQWYRKHRHRWLLSPLDPQ